MKHCRQHARRGVRKHMSTATEIALLWAAFTASHLGLASVRVEPRLRAKLGDVAFLGLYSVVALAIFVPLVRLYFANRHAGGWLWLIDVTPPLRAVLYVVMTLATVLVVGSLLKPSPASVAPGKAEVAGVYRVTRHPMVLGLALLFALHLIPNAGATDVAFFGGFVAFAVLGAWHQDARKLHAPPPGFREFHAGTRFLPFTSAAAFRGLGEIPPLVWALGLALSAFARYWHPTGVW
jgi:uncharacterized membrane protein